MTFESVTPGGRSFMKSSLRLDAVSLEREVMCVKIQIDWSGTLDLSTARAI
jgi:hypothetical protein